MMTRKNYIAFAEAVATYGHRWMDEEHLENSPWRLAQEQSQNNFADAIADVLATDNPRFNRSKFMTACALREEHQ